MNKETVLEIIEVIDTTLYNLSIDTLENRQTETQACISIGKGRALGELKAILLDELAKQRWANIKLNGDMAQQFNESQEDEELYEGQDDGGL